MDIFLIANKFGLGIKLGNAKEINLHFKKRV